MSRNTKNSSKQEDSPRSLDASHLFAIQEKELPEVIGSSHEKLNEPAGAEIIASFTPTHESFLQRIMHQAVTDRDGSNSPNSFEAITIRNSESQTCNAQHGRQTRQNAHQSTCHDGNSTNFETPAKISNTRISYALLSCVLPRCISTATTMAG
jgi:hypothetical protein